MAALRGPRQPERGRGAGRSGVGAGLCRDLLALRRAEFGGRLASYTQLPSPPGLWVYQTGRLTVLANFTGSPVRLAEPLAELAEVLVSMSPAGEAAEAACSGPGRGSSPGPSRD